MKKIDLFLKAMQAGNYKRLDWIRQAFCLVMEAQDAYKEEPYPYRIVQQQNGYFFINPDKEYSLDRIEDAKVGEELFKQGEKITLAKDSLPNVDRDLTTTIGNVLLNQIVLVYPFGKLFPFIEGKVTVKQIEKLILGKIEDDPKEGVAKEPGHLYVSDYLKFTEAMGFIRELVDIFVPAASKATLTPPPGIVEYRNKLLKENQDRLHDPAVLARIDEALVEYDKAYLKDDDDAQGFMLKPTFQKEVRRKLFLSVGVQSGFKDGAGVNHVSQSLSEGASVEQLPVLNSAARVGSFNRGHQTMNGGAQFKRLLRAASNSTITTKDCGTKVAKPFYLTKENASAFLGFYAQTDKGAVKLTTENLAQFTNKTVFIRSTQYCKAEKTDYCQVCSGERLSLHPEALAIAVSDIGSIFLNLFLKKMHVTGRSAVKMDYKEVLI